MSTIDDGEWIPLNDGMKDGWSKNNYNSRGLQKTVSELDLEFARSLEETREATRHKKEVSYDIESNTSVLLQMYGSVLPRVLPYCVLNVVLTAAVCILKERGVDLTIPGISGHEFMATMVSFTVVTRASITYHRFMEARKHLASVFRSCREVVQYVCVLTMGSTSEEAMQWRREVAYDTIVLLRTTVAALEHRSSEINTWEVIPDDVHSRTQLFLDKKEHCQTKLSSYKAQGEEKDESFFSRCSHGPRTLADENFRTPVVWIFNLRQAIMKPKSGRFLERELHPYEEMEILKHISHFSDAYHQLKKLVRTPFPFPLVQMARTFLFFFVFTLPFVLAHEIERPLNCVTIMFLITYGFLGIEYVSIELDDPYGDDPNDFSVQLWAEMVFEDIYIYIMKTDGYDSATKLRSRICDRIARKRGRVTDS